MFKKLQLHVQAQTPTTFTSKVAHKYEPGFGQEVLLEPPGPKTAKIKLLG